MSNNVVFDDDAMEQTPHLTDLGPALPFSQTARIFAPPKILWTSCSGGCATRSADESGLMR